MKEKNNKSNNTIPEGMILPSIKMDKGAIRKTLIDNNGMTYEVEQEIDLPIVVHRDDKG